MKLSHSVSATASLCVLQTDQDVKVTVDLPGTKKEDIKVELNKGLLTISAERKAEAEEKNKTFTRQERSYGMVKVCVPVILSQAVANTFVFCSSIGSCLAIGCADAACLYHQRVTMTHDSGPGTAQNLNHQRVTITPSLRLATMLKRTARCHNTFADCSKVQSITKCSRTSIVCIPLSLHDITVYIAACGSRARLCGHQSRCQRRVQGRRAAPYTQEERARRAYLASSHRHTVTADGNN